MRIVLIIVLICCFGAGAATYNSDGTQANIQALHNAAAPSGDIITVPIGLTAWTGTLYFTNAITLQGLGTVYMNATGRATNCQAKIRDDRSSGGLIAMFLSTNGLSRITGIEFTNGGNHTPGEANGLIVVNGLSDSRRGRIDHCAFLDLGISAVGPQTWLGVFDHNTIRADHQLPFGYVKDNSWGGTDFIDLYGDGAYADGPQFGTDKFLFVEDNDLLCSWVGHVTMIDGSCGSRVVVRYNYIRQGSIENHGAEADRTRSGQANELYMNTFVGNDSGSSVLFSRGGTWICSSNTISGYTSSATFNLLNDRSREPLFAPMGPSDGRNPWDQNNSGNPFDTATVTTGTVISQTNVSFIATFSGKSWTPGQWAGYTLRRTSGKTVSSLTLVGFLGTVASTGHGYSVGHHVSLFNANEYDWNYRYTVASVPDADHFTFIKNWASSSPATGTIKLCGGAWFSEIITNTATTITYFDSGYYAVTNSFPYTNDWPMFLATGDIIEILKVDRAFDMVGVQGGTALSGGIPSVAGWITQTNCPNYEWGNTREAGANVSFTNGAVGGPHRIIVPGTNYINDTVKPGYSYYTYPHPIINNAPTISSVTVGASGTTITVQFSTTCTNGPASGNDWAPSMTGGGATWTMTTPLNGSTATLTSSRTIMATETGSVTYSAPGNGIKDTSGVELPTQSGISVINNSTQSGVLTTSFISPPSPPGKVRRQ